MASRDPLHEQSVTFLKKQTAPDGRLAGMAKKYAQRLQLAAALGGDIMEHGGGHVVPVRDLGGEIADWVRAHSAADYGVPV